MRSFSIKPGETVVGLGIDFGTRLAPGETLASVSVAADSGITVGAHSVAGTIALATISVALGHADADLSMVFTATGSAGSVRVGTRSVLIRAGSN